MLKLVGLGPARDHALEYVGEPGQGSTPFSLAVATRLATIAQWQAPPSDPANKAFLRPRLIGRIARSTVLVCVPCPKVPRLGGFDPHPAALAPAGSTPDGSGGDE
jgi:hypothetical protein